MRLMEFRQALIGIKRIAIYVSAGMPTHRLCVELFRFVGGEDEHHLLAESIGLIDPSGDQLT